MEQNVNRNRKTKYGHKTWEKLGHGEKNTTKHEHRTDITSPSQKARPCAT